MPSTDDIIMPFGKRFEDLTVSEALTYFKAAKITLLQEIEGWRALGLEGAEELCAGSMRQADEAIALLTNLCRRNGQA